MAKTLSSILMILLLCACHRKAIHKNHPDMSGGWHHTEYPSKNHWYISIGEKSWGNVTVYDSTGRDLSYNGENGRRWRYNENTKRLYNGIISPTFIINQLPLVAQTQIIHNFDTIDPGETYCIINESYYKKY